MIDDGSVESTLVSRATTLNSVVDHGPASAERSHGMARERATHTPHPAPVQCAISVRPDSVRVPRNAKKIADAALALDWPVRITHAIGYDTSASGAVKTTAIKEPTGEITPTGRPAMKEVDHALAPPVNSIRVVIQAPDRMLVGHWLDNGWDGGLILVGHRLLANCQWAGLWKEFENAKSRAHLRGETSRAERESGQQLSLTGDDGKPL